MKCQICNKEFKFINNTHLAKHNISVKQYKDIYGECMDSDLKIIRGNHTRGKTYEQIHGKTKAKKLKNTRSKSAKKQMKTPNQIKLRRQKCGIYKDNKQRIENMKAAYKQDPTITIRRRKTMIKRYGTSNTANISPRFSKEAYIFIKKYLSDNNIDESRCYFNRGGINNTEYYQHVNDKFYCYDLVILSKDKTNIETILEYNGPWHYRKCDVVNKPNLPSTPFKSNKMTVKESYEHDLNKLQHASLISNQVLVYWADTKSYEIVK